MLKSLNEFRSLGLKKNTGQNLEETAGTYQIWKILVRQLRWLHLI